MSDPIPPASHAQLISAIKAGDDLIVERLLLGDPTLAMARDDLGISALITSLYYRQKMITALLLDQGLVLDIFEAAGVGDAARVRQLLNADPTLACARSVDGFTPLHYAAFWGHGQAAKHLLSHGADPSAISDNAMRVQPLHSAVAGRHHEVARILLEAGADANARQEGGYTPMDAAAEHQDPAMVSLLEQFGGKATPGSGLAVG